MADLKAIQRGTKTLADTASSMTIDRGVDTGFDTTVTTSKTLLRVTARTANGAVANAGVAAKLTDGDTITVTRFGTSGAVVVHWELIEWTSGVVVQQVTFTIASAAASDTAAISAASLGGGRWIEATGAVCSSSVVPNYMARLQFDSATQVSATRSGSPAVALTIEAQVVEYDDCTVQTVDITLTTTTLTQHDETVTAVADVAQTMIVGSTDAAGQNAINDTWWSMTLSDTTSLILDRATGDSATFNFTVFLVEFSDATSVQRTAYSAAATSIDITISAVTVARASAAVTGVDPWQTGNVNAFDGSEDRAMLTSELTTTTNHQLQVTTSTGTKAGYSQVVEFPEAASTNIGPLAGEGGLAGGDAGLAGGSGRLA